MILNILHFHIENIINGRNNFVNKNKRNANTNIVVFISLFYFISIYSEIWFEFFFPMFVQRHRVCLLGEDNQVIKSSCLFWFWNFNWWFVCLDRRFHGQGLLVLDRLWWWCLSVFCSCIQSIQPETEKPCHHQVIEWTILANTNPNCRGSNERTKAKVKIPQLVYSTGKLSANPLIPIYLLDIAIIYLNCKAETRTKEQH